MSVDQTIRRFLVRGRVQGVGFRWFVEREAALHNLSGWVRNNSDSTVEVMATGTPDALAALLVSLSEGPRAARVDGVEELPLESLSDAGHTGLQTEAGDGRRAFRVS